MTRPEKAENDPAARSVRLGGRLLVALILASLAWYLAADRYTPYTRQARVQAFVIGVAPRVSGMITEIRVRNDQEVARGDPLFRIDPRPWRIALERARADHAAAEARLAAARSSIRVARAALDAAIANREKAEKDARRQRNLHRKDPGSISLRRVEMAEASWKEAIARVTRAEADLQKAREQEQVARERLLAARAAVDKAELDLENTLVRAPVAGVITSLTADVGDHAGTGKAMMTLVATHDVWIEAQYTENNLGHLRPGTPVEFVLDALPGRVFEGEVRSIGLGVSTGPVPRPGQLPDIANSRDWLRPAQRFPVEIRFERRQPGLEPQALRVGGQAEVIAYTEEARLLRPLAWLYIRFMSLLSYAY